MSAARQTDLRRRAPAGAATSTLRYRVPFFDTDGMRIVHHANYVRYLELARIVFLDEHDEPYRDYVAQGLHFAVTRVEVDYRRAARFDDLLEVHCWCEWVRGASLEIGYAIDCEGEAIASARTRHAMVDDTGRPVRIPGKRRAHLASLAAPAPG